MGPLNCIYVLLLLCAVVNVNNNVNNNNNNLNGVSANANNNQNNNANVNNNAANVILVMPGNNKHLSFNAYKKSYESTFFQAESGNVGLLAKSW